TGLKGSHPINTKKPEKKPSQSFSAFFTKILPYISAVFNSFPDFDNAGNTKKAYKGLDILNRIVYNVQGNEVKKYGFFYWINTK
ncbi:MAG: hypothetical protein K2L18_10430, partial [Acetatifactor sp.]|nr:hypothetical protein [Acetatifactor sp.]